MGEEEGGTKTGETYIKKKKKNIYFIYYIIYVYVEASQ